MEYLKKAIKKQAAEDSRTGEIVAGIISDVESRGEAAVRHWAEKLDQHTGDILLAPEKIEEIVAGVPQAVKDDLAFAYEQVHGFAVKQREHMQGFETEIFPGAVLGQKLIPVSAAGCYVPGGRYAHAASAIMSLATARAAGVPYVVAATPPYRDGLPHPALLAAMWLSRPDAVLCLGGVQGVAAMAFGVFTGRPVDIIVGPGNRFVTEAKRLLFGRVGLDVLAGPSESMILADDSADPLVAAVDLVSQAEHGLDSPVWLATDSREFAEKVIKLVPKVADDLPGRDTALASWQDYGEVILCADREEMVRVSDQYAPEHLQVICREPEWYLEKLTNYGSLFLGEETTVSYGDKAAGTNHILPTRLAARYSGGLSVRKFIKSVTYQKMTREASLAVGQVTSRISRLEGMEGHARAADLRLRKYAAGRDWDFEVYGFDHLSKNESGSDPPD